MWFSIALSSLPASETEKRNQATTNRDAVAYTMAPEQVAEAQRSAAEWKPKKER
jgi:hypothetical protein